MKKYLFRFKSILAFTLIELIIVIAIISILAAIVVIFIDPSTLFGGGRNGKRNNDLSTYQSSLSKFLAETPPTGITRSLDSLVGFSSLYSSATSTSPYGNCPGLSNGNTSNINGGYLIVDNSNTGNPTNNPNTINFQPLIDNGYLNGALLNPYGTGTYYACVDTTNNNQLVLYDPTTDNKTTVSKSILNIDSSSTGSITSGSGNGGGVGNNSVSYNCPISSSYSSGSCSAQSSYYYRVLGNIGDSIIFNIAIDSSSNAYVANSGYSNVSKITPSGVSSILGTTETNGGPQGIAIDSAGNVYTANFDSNNVSKITPSGVSSILGTTGNGPKGIAIDSAGNVYTANFDSNNVSKITPSGISSILGATGSYPWGIAIDSAGNIYTTNTSSINVSKITPSGISSILGTTADSPYGIAVDASGNVYIENINLNNVSKITPSGVSSILGTTGIGPRGITVDSAGNIYTINTNGSGSISNVSKITSSGISSTIGITGPYADAIATDSLGNIYVSNSLSPRVISKLSPNPNAVLTISPSTIKVNQPYNLGLNNVISSGVRVNSGTCTLQVTDTITVTIVQTLSGNMNNGACKPIAFNALTTTHPLSILATISATSQTFTYSTTPQ